MTAKNVARLLWLAPLFLLFLIFHQTYTAWNVHRILSKGVVAKAYIGENRLKRPPGLNHLKLTLKVEAPDGTRFEKKMTLPEEESYHLGGEEIKKNGYIQVKYLPENPQDLVLVDKDKNGKSIGERQRATAFINLATLILFIFMIGIPILLWNRYLDKHGDPGEQVA